MKFFQGEDAIAEMALIKDSVAYDISSDDVYEIGVKVKIAGTPYESPIYLNTSTGSYFLEKVDGSLNKIRVHLDSEETALFPAGNIVFEVYTVKTNPKYAKGIERKLFKANIGTVQSGFLNN